MIDLSFSDLLGGEPVTDTDKAAQIAGPVWHVHLSGDAQNIYEKVIADTYAEAAAKAYDLIGDIEGLAVTGPHEHIAPKPEQTFESSKDAGRKTDK